MQFGRIASVEIHPQKSEELLRIEGLRTTFKVKKTLKKTANQAEIAIYNLSDGTRFQIKEMETRILLRAGYEAGGGLFNVFEGNAVSVNHSHETPNVVSRIEVMDGVKAMRDTQFIASYAEGADVLRVFDDLVAKVPLTKKVSARVREVLKGKKLLSGFTSFGPAVLALDGLCKSMGLEFSVQDMHLQVLEKGGAFGENPSSSVVLLSPDSGLIASPERLRQLQEEMDPEKRPPGWRIRCLLQPTLSPGDWVAVQCREIPRATAFRVQAVEHQGDTHPEGGWETILEVADPGRLL